ncbi:MAG: tetratricopeptide repeat protein [Candidatus Krumholzibacteriia bacterium]
MRGTWSGGRPAPAVWALLALSVIVAGCQKQGGSAELDQFLARAQKLPGPQREALLRQAVGAGGRQAVFAHYALGNEFYAAATDSSTAGATAGAAALLDSARVHFEQAALDTTFVEAQVNLGSVWDDMADLGGPQAERQTRLDNAEAAYRRALALRPTDEKALCNLGALYVKKRQYPEAVAQFRKALAAHPRSALAHYNLAILFAETKIYREAKVEWAAAAKDDPKGDIGRRSLANVRIVEQMMSAQAPGGQGGPPQARP